MVVVGAIFGVAIGGCLNDTFERKLLILIVDVLLFPGAVIMSITLVSWVIIIRRIFVSLGVGMDLMTAPLYISEASPHKIISALVSLNDLLITGGQFLSYLINLAFTDVKEMWRWILGIAGLPTVIQFGLMIILLESPKWLYRKGKTDELRDILAKIYPAEKVDNEMMAMKKLVEEAKKIEGSIGSSTFTQIKKAFEKAACRRALYADIGVQVA
ncbi:putative inositol transporter 3 [Capsicum chinense]|nr:putative inositol transporter 3 [Capsicum chinense]